MYRQAVGAATSLLVRGSQGNIPIIGQNLGIELLNEQYGKELGLRKEKNMILIDTVWFIAQLHQTI